MSASKNRHKTMQLLIRSSRFNMGSIDFGNVDVELGELGRCQKTMPENRKRLLQVIHASRALDTGLKGVLLANGKMPKFSLGPRLHQLNEISPASRGYLPYNTIKAFVSSICSKRNNYAHNANAFPSSTYEVDKLISDIHACLASIV